ncbi:MAG: tRNA pseudouridine(55) synthase TruB [Syntrophomonadaceae bacterium]|nr:tRNA pseudouridine(55) synthase TruB [Syntrophomonadaceae bacterium]
MDGFINVDKPQGITSFGVVKQLQRLIPRTKLGHLGTLDPMASGVLPVAVGHATRLIEYVKDTDKVYRAQMTLGGVSDTLDAWGNITYKQHLDFAAEMLPEVLRRFTGTISQIPPMYSAVHHQGARLYELARRGITVERESREVEIKFLRLEAISKDLEGRPVITLEVGCSQGTYIRSLCHDIGMELGTGAFLSALVRTRAGVFAIETAHGLDEIKQNGNAWQEWILPADFPLDHLPRLTVSSAQMQAICNVNRIVVSSPGISGVIRVYSPADSLAAIAQASILAAGTEIRPLKVLCPRAD